MPYKTVKEVRRAMGKVFRKVKTKRARAKAMRQVWKKYKKNPVNARPPKKWFDRCVRTVKRESPEVYNPQALCGWIWYHHAKPATIREIVADLPKAKTALKLKILRRVLKKRYGENGKKASEKEKKAHRCKRKVEK